MLKLNRAILLCLVSAIFLSACDNDSAMVSDFEKTRSFFNKRTGNTTAEADQGIHLRKWYSWQNDENTTDLKAPDEETRLFEAKVINVVDGDTIDIAITNDKEERVRLILVNTPESKGKYENNPQPYALAAYEFTKSMLLDRTIWIEKGIEERDKYGRLLAYVWLDNVVLNEEVESNDGEVVILGNKIGMITLNELLLREGLAHVAVYPPNTKYVDEYEVIQKEAKKEEKGMWEK